MVKNPRRALVTLQREWGSCDSCALSEHRQCVATGRGLAGSDREWSTSIMFVYDRPSPSDLTENERPAGDNAEVLHAILDMLGHDYNKFWATPVTLCPTRGPNTEDEWRTIEIMPAPDAKHIHACKPRLDEEINLINPRVIVACGSGALNAFIPKSDHARLLGEIVDAPVQGVLVPVTRPVMVTHGLNKLYRDQDMSKGGTWNQAHDHIQTALLIAEALETVERTGELPDTSLWKVT